MEYTILENNYYIKNKRFFIDGIKVISRDLIKYNCEKCGNACSRIFSMSGGVHLLCKKCKMKQTKLEKYGNENYNNSNKTKITNLKKYGVKCVFQSQEIKDKIKNTNLEKYGVEYIWKSLEIRKKIIETNLIKYNSISPFGNEYIFSKSKKTKFIRYNNEHYTNTESLKKTVVEKTFNNFSFNAIPLFTIKEFEGIGYYKKYKWKCKVCNTEFEDHIYSHIPRCPVCFPYYKSIGEQELFNYCKTLNVEIIENDRSLIYPYEIDIYLPDYKLAIEYNGLYWHNIDHVDKWYHQRKIELAYRQGVRLLHVWEHEELEDIKKVIHYYINNDDSIKAEKPKLYNIKGHLIWI